MSRITSEFHLILLATLIAVGGCEVLDPNPGPDPIGLDAGTTKAPPPDTTPATPERGAQLYAQYCARCHGDSAEGTKIWPAPIQGRFGIADIIHSGRRAMPGFPGLSDSAIAAIELFLRSFRVDYGNKSGEQLFDTYCSSCHGDSALGTSIFPGSIQGYEPIHDIVRSGQREMKPIDLPDSVIARIQEYLKSFSVDLSTLSGAEYYARECAKCHGSAGEGTTRGYEIRNPVAGYARWVIRNGRPGPPFANAMKGYSPSELSDTQLDEIIAMLRAAQKPSDGQSLYNRFCSNCHGKDGRGGPVGEGVRDEIDEILEKVREGEGGNRYAQRRDYMPRWSSQELTDQEVSAIAVYISRMK